MSTGYSWEGIRQVPATLLGARHVPERLRGGHVYLGRYIKCSTFTFYLQLLSSRLDRPSSDGTRKSKDQSTLFNVIITDGHL